MLKRGAYIALVALVFGGSGKSVRAADLLVKAGIGYEFLSQQYFLDSAQLEGPDPSLTAWQLRSVYLDDVKGQVAATWHPLIDRSLEIRGSLEQTADFLRLKTSGNYRYRPGQTRIDLDGELEWRNRFGRSNEFGDSYLLGYGRARAAVPVGPGLHGTGQLRVETIDFRSDSAYSADYLRAEAKIGVEKSFENLSFGDLRLIVGARRAPDSTTMNFQTIGAEATFFGFLPTGDLDVAARYEFKDYNRPDDLDDHHRVEAYGNNRINLGSRWLLRQQFDIEAIFYRTEDWISRDYLRLRAAVLPGLTGGSITLTAGPEIELLTELGEETIVLGEDYFESGLKLDIDYLRAGGMFISFESATGYRDLELENDLQTNFIFERIYLIGDIELVRFLNLSVLLSAEWEWHRQQQNNTELYLLSSSLTYSF